MSTTVGDLFKQASALDEQDRATLAGLLLESLEYEVDEDVESAWSEEITRRLAELDAGNVQTVSWEAVKTNLMRITGAERTG
ncbi:addiction module protein [Candidatus Entotheonella palauensis]|uniref:Addiction module antitoxin RelB n=1 Tax=Candidatus Entotheonella gemina TaxID=1429439 RepID=W4ME38_9BACT|nr:addiction module protein [Candidatus Entotheonella palauensis]ETX08483.1 MAG: hypothetical protein ETSY2_05170 [Candidatus Entotheonella gemina]